MEAQITIDNNADLPKHKNENRQQQQQQRGIVELLKRKVN
jgi:hypothetical protein